MLWQGPPLLNKKTRALIQEKNAAFKNHRSNSSNTDLKCRLKYLQACPNAFVEVTKEMYYHHTVNKLIIDTQKNSKVCIFSWRYWGKIIRNCDSNKAQGHDKISIHMLYFRFVAKYLKNLFLTKCLTLSPIINSSLKTNLVIPISTSCYPLPTQILHLLVID